MKNGTKNGQWMEDKMADIEISKLITHYAHSNRAEGKSPRTIEWYTAILDDYLDFLKTRGCGTTLSQLGLSSVREFVVQEQDRGLSAYSVAGKVRSLKAFSSWLFREGYISENILTNCKPPKVPFVIVEPLSSVEIDLLVRAHDPMTLTGCRDIAILTLMLDTGIRLSELCGLRLEEVNVDGGYCKVLGKGNKERVVPFGALTQKVLWRWLIHFRPEPLAAKDKYFFLTIHGNYMMPNAVKLLMIRWGKRAGVPRLHAHLLRHTFATNYLLYQCGDVFRLQLILGHTSLGMVNRYVHLASTQAMVNGKVVSPVDQLGIQKLKRFGTDRSPHSGFKK
ncbi:integrase/recombinase XerD [Dehalogenimonas sp. WBC-2]|nr:integrase/recombinase XerD [Dehalogenimonas sp. WBC-2]